MKELEEENLNEVEEINANEEVETTDFSDEEIEMVELSENEENEVEGGGSYNWGYSTFYLPKEIANVPYLKNQRTAIVINNELNFCDQNRNGVSVGR